MKETIHDRDGIRIAGPEATGNIIQGNRIGVGLAGDPLPNGSADPEARGGVYLRGEASGNTVGGSEPGAGNEIAHNLLAGVWLDSGLGNTVRGNAIHDNTGLGLDLAPGGVTPNDELDKDSGANHLQNSPVLASAASDGTTTTVEGALNSAASTTFTLDFYASPSCDASGHGEGATYLGAAEVTTDANGNAGFSANVPVAVAEGQVVTATATDPDGNTSEFSACVTATATIATPDAYDWHYTYDGLGRLTSACSQWDAATETCTGDAFSYAYDGAGNLLTLSRWDAASGQVETVSYLYNGANQIRCVDADLSGACDGAEMLWQYDAYGNLLDDGVHTYSYDAALRLVSVSDGVSTTTYAYNGDGDRVSQAVDGVTTTYLLDTATPLTMVLAEQTGTDPAIYYLHALDLVAQSDGAATEYFLYDGLGSVRQVADETGSPLLAQTFDPYGSLYARAGEGVTRFGYTGEYGDSNGLLYLRARYYAPSQGRFFQLDPSRLEMNPYLYGAGNPILFVDPSGNICLDPFGPTGVHFRAEGCGYPAPNLATRMTEQVARTLEDVSLLLTDCGAQDAFWAGYSDQLFTDLSLGLWTDTYERWFGSQYAYWIGRRSGRIASNLLTGIEFYVGSTTALAASAAVPPTLLGGAACTAASGGTCVIPVIVAVGAEGVVVVAGTAVAVHGLAVAGNNMFNPISGIGGTGSGQNRVLNIDDQQFGKKVGKHARDYGLDPSDRTSREWIRQHIEDVFYNADEIREGSWRGLGPDGSLGDARFYIQGNDVVVTDVNNNLVTILRDGIHNARVIGGRTVWP